MASTAAPWRSCWSPFEVVAYKIGMNYAEPFLVQGTATIGDAELDQAAADYVSAILD